MKAVVPDVISMRLPRDHVCCATTDLGTFAKPIQEKIPPNPPLEQGDKGGFGSIMYSNSCRGYNSYPGYRIDASNGKKPPGPHLQPAAVQKPVADYSFPWNHKKGWSDQE